MVVSRGSEDVDGIEVTPGPAPYACIGLHVVHSSLAVCHLVDEPALDVYRWVRLLLVGCRG